MADLIAKPRAFDGVASRYDREFTDQQLGGWLRGVVWSELDQSFRAGDQVLDLGCGTGEDACHLAELGISVTAIDASPGMLDVAEAKIDRRGCAQRVRLNTLDLRDIGPTTDLASLSGGRVFDGAYANFGPLNCLNDRRPLADALARSIKPGGSFIAVVMGPLCPWEFGWYLLHGHPRTAVRRFRRGVPSEVGGGQLRVWYPSPRRLSAEFSPYFEHVKTIGVGVFLPPSDFGRLVERAPRLFGYLKALDDRTCEHLPFSWLNDHYLSVFRRNGEDSGR